MSTITMITAGVEEVEQTTAAGQVTVKIFESRGGGAVAWYGEKTHNEESPLDFRPILTQLNLTTLSGAMFSMPNGCGGLSGPL